MSVERFHDGEDIEASPGRPLRAEPGLDRTTEKNGRRLDPAAEHETRDRVVAELAAENAEQAKTIERLQARADKAEARADMTDARWRAWVKEMANREDERAARDETRDKREEAMIGRLNELEDVVMELRGANDGVGGPSRIEKRASAAGERHERPRPSKPSDNFIALGTAVSVEALTAAVDPTGPNLLIGAVGIIGASIPWIRKLKEEHDAGRSQGGEANPRSARAGNPWGVPGDRQAP